MEVQVLRREQVSHLPTEVINESKVFLGSHFVRRQPLKGLSDEEERKYLPRILGISPEHPEFERRSQDFWAEMGFLVPSSGVVLDVTKNEDGTPYNLEDWIKYQWALKHKLVAINEQELLRDPRKKFYIRDPQEQDRLKNATIQSMKAADVEFIKATKDPAKARRIIRMMTKTVNPDTLNDAQAENVLYDIKQKDPVTFYKIASDSKLDVKAEIMELVELDVLRKIGNQVIYIDDIIAETFDDAVIWYQNPKNSSIVATLKAKLNEVRKRTN